MEGFNFGLVSEVHVNREVSPGETMEIRLDFKAPDFPGSYCAMYRLTYDEGHKKFGDKLWCDIKVLEPPQPEEEDMIARLQREISVYPAEEQPKSSIVDSFSQPP